MPDAFDPLALLMEQAQGAVNVMTSYGYRMALDALAAAGVRLAPPIEPDEDGEYGSNWISVDARHGVVAVDADGIWAPIMDAGQARVSAAALLAAADKADAQTAALAAADAAESSGAPKGTG